MLKSKGLATFHNELQLAEGSLLTADNIVIDRNDIVRPRRGFGDYGSCGLAPPACPCCPCVNIRVDQLIGYKDRILLHYCCRLFYDCCSNLGCFSAFTGTVAAACSNVRIKSKESNGNLYLTSSTGIKKISGTIVCCATNFCCGACTISCAGGPKGLNTTATLFYQTGGFLPIRSKTAYRIVWGIKDNNSNFIQGAPSSRIVIGNKSETTAADVCITTTIPTEITSTDYFYRINRTAVVCTACICCFCCLAPGDEMNLVIEAALTQAQITAGSITVRDETPDCLREVGVLLYTNCISGEGILQQNDKPPLAKDIELFRNSTFYGNTTNIQRFQFNLLSTCVSCCSICNFIIANCCGVRRYKFQGASEKQDITTIAKACVTNKSYFLMNSARNERKYFFWMNTCCACCTTAPSAADTLGRIPVKVCIVCDVTAINVASTLCTAICCLNGDFTTTGTFSGTTSVFLCECVSVACDQITETGHTLTTGERGQLTVQIGSASTTPSACISTCCCTITEAAHCYTAGERGRFTTSCTFPSFCGCVICACTDYYIIALSCCTYNVATSRANALACTGVCITGAGVGCQTFTPNGTLPTELCLSTNYFVIDNGTNTYQLATSKVNAVACTAINIITLNSPASMTFTSNCSTIIVCWAKNGIVDDTADGTTTTCFVFPCVTTQGLGECLNPTGNESTSAFMLRSNILSVGEQICESANSIINVINKDIAVKEVTTFTATAKACLTAGESFLFNGALDASKIQFYYDFCCAVSAPTCCNACYTNVEINITCDTTAAQVAARTNTSICGQAAFTSSVCCATITVTNAVVGFSTNAADIDTCYTFTETTNGKNAGIANAFYLSSECDLPGIILLEGKTLGSGQFYVFADPTSAYNPNFPSEFSVICTVATACAGVRTRFTTSTAHNLAVGQEVFIFECGKDGSDDHATFGKQTITAVPCACTFDITVAFVAGFDTPGSVFRITDFNKSDNEEHPNRIYFSKESQPEAVPLVNFLDVGAKDDPIRRILALRDNLFVLKDDGVFILTGGPAPSFTVRLLDNSTSIIAADSAAVLNNQIYMLSTQGVATVSDTGIGIISRPIEDQILDITRPGFCSDTISFGIGYESDRSYLLWMPTACTDTIGTQVYRYNTFNQSWVRWTVCSQAAIVNPVDDKIYHSGASNFVKQERKTRDRTDFADAKLCLTVPVQCIPCCILKLELSNVCCVAIGDALVQDQFLTITKFHRLLRKLDLDVGLDCNDYFSTLSVCPGVCLAVSLVALEAKICTDDCTACYTGPTAAPSTFATMRTEFNTLTTELNASTKPSFSDYFCIAACDNTEYEILVTGICADTSQACVGFNMPILAGPICQYKGINSVVEWAPQHFGEPSIVKQVSEGTILFDGNNFFDAKIAYSSDLSKDFTERNFVGQGTGYWGGFVWGCSAWGGEGTDVPYRTLIPRQKQRCRYITVKFTHINAREEFSVLGISLEVRPLSSRGYRSIS